MPRIYSRKRASIPSITGKSHAERISELYEKLGITELDAESVPKITPILKELPGKIDKAVEFLRGSNEPDARKWLIVYDSLAPSYRKLLPFEAYCVAANLTTKRVLELVTGACFEQSTVTAVLLAKASHPALVKKSIAFAKEPSGWEDRKMFHQKEGFAPIPKTQVINVQGDVNTDNRVQSINIGELSGIESKMARIEDRFNERLGMGDRSERLPVLDTVDDDNNNTLDSVCEEVMPNERVPDVSLSAVRVPADVITGDHGAVEETSNVESEWEID